jgi:predicted ABC-type transport system involved in lysophospholipase L1 biosynthesis ATPase subunit
MAAWMALVAGMDAVESGTVVLYGVDLGTLCAG